MNQEEFKKLVQMIVAEASKLRDVHTNEYKAPVNYACVFSQNEGEYESFLAIAKELGEIVKETKMGPVFHVDPIQTIAGDLRIVKVRKPDSKRKERGDADFTVSDYQNFKKEYLNKPGFGIIERPEMEIIELIDPEFSAIAYFSHPPLGEILGLEF